MIDRNVIYIQVPGRDEATRTDGGVFDRKLLIVCKVERYQRMVCFVAWQNVRELQIAKLRLLLVKKKSKQQWISGLLLLEVYLPDWRPANRQLGLANLLCSERPSKSFC